MGEKSGHPARCVVWTGASAAVPTALSRVLSARGVPVVHASSAHAAMAEVCLAQRAGNGAALILCGSVDSGRVVSALERFAPRAVVWVYEEGANPALRPLVEGGQAPPASRPEGPPNGPSEGSRRGVAGLRLIREAGSEGSNGRADSGGPKANGAKPAISARDVLDDAELEMLLAGERAMEDPR